MSLASRGGFGVRLRRSTERLRHLIQVEEDFERQRLARLTDGQRDCLRLVGQYLSSKEIARRLDISPHTVDQRLKRATLLLELPTRFEAARLYMKHFGSDASSEQDEMVYDPLVYQRPELAIPQEYGTYRSSLGNRDRSGDGASDELHEYQERYFAGVGRTQEPASLWSQIVGVQHENSLSVQARLAIMAAIAFCAVLGFAALISVAEGLSRLS